MGLCGLVLRDAFVVVLAHMGSHICRGKYLSSNRNEGSNPVLVYNLLFTALMSIQPVTSHRLETTDNSTWLTVYFCIFKCIYIQ